MPQRNSELAELIRNEIVERGSISFARFMERALLEPRLGYYVGARVRAGADGDFMTAPELHPLLGVGIANLAESTWERLGRPDRFRWIEFGAGSGALLVAALRHLARERSPLLNTLEIHAIEANPHRREELLDAVSALGITTMPRVVVAAHAESTDASESRSSKEAVAGIVVANEFLDALPVHIVVGRGAAPAGFLERRVGIDRSSGELIWIEAPPDESVAVRLAARVAAHTAAAAPLVEGQLAEFCLAADTWVAALPRLIARGVVVVIDYGRDATTLRDPATRMAGTALAYSAHRATSDLLGDPGERDLTAHIDLTALRSAALAAGLVPIASTTQAQFLAGAGLDAEIERLRSGPEATLEGALALRAALASLMDPRGMGGFAVELFAVGSVNDHAVLADPAQPLPGTAAPIRRLV